MAVTVTQVIPPTGAPFAAATITVDSVRNTEDVMYFLTTAAGAANGAIQADYTLDPTTGAPTVRDTGFFQPNGSSVITYYGNEATNPTVLAVEAAVPGFLPANPGFAFTQYTYSAPNVLAQVTATDFSGKTYVGTGTGVL